MPRPIASISGFPEWLPQERLVEQLVLDQLREVFELNGFSPIETRAVEPLSQLLRKGETSKEIYLLSRLQGEAAEEASLDPKRLGLHFDLTVPFARYISENAGKLAFPFKRYQIQKVWRGERPQDGRYREFIQADIDVVGQGELAFHHEVELPLVMARALSALGIPAFKIHVNNRKLVQGICQANGVEDVEEALRILDKLDKIGADQVSEELIKNGISESGAATILKMAQISGDAQTVSAALAEFGVENDLFEEGKNELLALLEEAEKRAPGVVIADLKIARGLDYYTGSVYESFIAGHEDLGSICSGGRYDNLITVGNKTYPGVGLSIGVSRLLARMLGEDLLTASRPTPTAVLVAVNDEATRSESNRIADALRERGIPTDVAPKAAKFGKQIRFADRQGIPYVWFPATEEGEADQVKDIRSGEQTEADLSTWQPEAADLRVRISRPK
ncbi:histidine--tRNA ligase [Boudabousia liubingyangii]|uniref:Histidine--tRNA ligase n=1 Tax=Boudabousia liubingyangii TaxID=1921764 RepID=A0A1Q5PNQ5_9ACTO|nr:histidine--tRNA ligase [Boudabousia liubingyangii]OKL49139.1 histidine--tRNA ligase [Boudabousia liubingyangii]